MKRRTQTESKRRLAMVRRVSSFKEHVRKRERSESYHISLSLIDSYLWSIKKLATSDTRGSQKARKDRLEQLQSLCLAGHEHVQNLQGAAMEIPELAPPGDETSVECLSILLLHENRYVRKNACKSIGLLGGKQAREILEEIVLCGDPEIKQVAVESLQYCETQEFTEQLEGDRLALIVESEEKIEELQGELQNMWTEDEVQVAVRHAIHPHEHFIKTMKAVFGILLAEIGLLFLFLLMEYIL